MKLVIAGGGTAGHVFPALALADRLVRDHGATVSFIGASTGQEASLVPEAGYRFDGVDAVPLYRELSWRAANAPLVALRSVPACRRLLAGADGLVGMGGYASVPAGIAARVGRIPLVLHEQNAVPSLANRLLAHGASAVGSTFADARSRFPSHVRFTVTGNPVRSRVLGVPSDRKRLADEAWPVFGFEPGRTTILVTGGSQGALHLDQVVAAALPRLAGRQDLQMLVLTGPAHAGVLGAVANGRIRVRAVPFLERMELAYAIADLCVSRAGAATISELAVCGVPMVLIPYPHATERHQDANAAELVRAGAASVVPDGELSPGRLVDGILDLVHDADRRRAMAAAAMAWARPDADTRLARLVVQAVSR
jgi:UDP-N-acetylglucosamine--N-acetylmuramyl-(pentapeptide) pyrophosphoryl-undecaprenol N-acetylglucosamine transferase